MYYLYKIRRDQTNTIYTYEDSIKIFGSVNGIIVKILKAIVPKNQGELYKWRINLRSDLAKINLSDHAVVIDLKPNTENNVSLYEIMNIFGYSGFGWTPMMFHLKGIAVDKDGGWNEKASFVVNVEDAEDIYTFHHVHQGSVKDGEIIGPWLPPRPSSTNSALLWQSSFDYFIEAKNIVENEP